MSLPHQLYVLEDESGNVRCQNRSMDEQTFYLYVSNAIWWRRNTDGTTTRIRPFGSVHSYGHTLNFTTPFSSENQGSYYCCLPDESACSNISVVKESSKLIFIVIKYSPNIFILAPPSIRAVNSTYTAVVGSQVTLKCNIIDPGVPKATFTWNKNGSAIHNDIVVKNSSISLVLNNLTMEDAGVYTCIARATVSNQNDTIELKVMQPINESNHHAYNANYI